MTVREIVAEWLKKNGYDGLVNMLGCECKLDDGFMANCYQQNKDLEAQGEYQIAPNCPNKCIPAYKAPVTVYFMTTDKPDGRE